MMTIEQAHRRRFWGALLAMGFAACQAREQPKSAQETPPAVAVATTATTTTTTTMPAPPPVWRNAKWGMTAAEVLAAFPGEAERLAQPASFGQARPGWADLAIPAYEADGAKFHVLFGFAAGALSRIQLAAAKPEAGVCEDVEKRLTAEHGAPSSRQDTATSMRTQEIVWALPAQTTTLACAEQRTLGFRTVTLDYAATAGP
jgi:hypothetical protein